MLPLPGLGVCRCNACGELNVYEGNHDAILVKDSRRLFTWGAIVHFLDAWKDGKETFEHHT